MANRGQGIQGKTPLEILGAVEEPSLLHPIRECLSSTYQLSDIFILKSSLKGQKVCDIEIII